MRAWPALRWRMVVTATLFALLLVFVFGCAVQP